MAWFQVSFDKKLPVLCLCGIHDPSRWEQPDALFCLSESGNDGREVEQQLGEEPCRLGLRFLRLISPVRCRSLRCCETSGIEGLRFVWRIQTSLSRSRKKQPLLVIFRKVRTQVAGKSLIWNGGDLAEPFSHSHADNREEWSWKEHDMYATLCSKSDHRDGIEAGTALHFSRRSWHVLTLFAVERISFGSTLGQVLGFHFWAA